MVKQLIVILCIGWVGLAQDDHAGEDIHLNRAQIWGFGIMAGIAISLIGFVASIILVLAKKCCNEVYFQNFIKFLFSLSCGALVGDAVIHILAESYENQQTNKRIVSLIFIASIVLFMIIDRLLHAFGVAHSHWVGQKCVDLKQNHDHHHHDSLHDHKHVHNHDHDHDHEHQHEHGHCHKQDHNRKQSNQQLEIDCRIMQENMESQNDIKKQSEQNTDKKQSKQIQGSSQDKIKQKACCCYNFAGKGSAGYMNIMGSFIHNFFDGLALGIAFATGNPTEIVPVLVAIVAHQIPRELGDVAILLKSQFTSAQTVICNGVINFLSLIGVVIGLAVANMSELIKLYIMVFVAGNFIYIAADIWQHVMKNHDRHCKKKNVLQFFGLSLGIGIMFILTLMEH